MDKYKIEYNDDKETYDVSFRGLIVASFEDEDDALDFADRKNEEVGVYADDEIWIDDDVPYRE